MSDNNDDSDSTGIQDRTVNKGMGASIAIAAVIGVVLLLAIIILRKKLPRYFMPKAYHTQGLKNPPELSKCSGWFNWIPYSIKYDEEKLFQEYGGIDMIQYLTFLKYCVVLFLVLTFFGLAALITNVTGEENNNNDLALSMSNIRRRSDRLWVHALSVAFFSFMVYIFFYKYEKKTTMDRSRDIGKDTPFGRSVMVEELRMDHASHGSLREIFGKLYGPQTVSNAFVAVDVREAEKIRKKREELVEKYKVAYYYFQETGEEKMVKPKFCGAKVPGREYYENEIRKLDEQLCTEQSRPHKLTRTGFVTFNSVASALTSAQTRHDREKSKMVITYAPDPAAINWDNLHKRTPERVIRTIISSILLVLLFAFWTIPVVFISGWSNLEALASVKGFGWVDFIFDLSPFLRGIVQGFLPGLALIIFMALLPTILTAIFNIRAPFLKSTVQRQVGTAYWLFLLLNVFLVVTIAGSATGALDRYINQPTKIPSDLAESLPSQSSFYFNFVAIHAFINNFIFLLAIPDLLIHIIKTLTSKSDYEKTSVTKPKPLPYFKTYANDLIIFTVGIVYSVMNPLLCAIVCIYFCIAYFAVKNYLIFVHKPEFNAILMNKVASTGTVTSIFIFQLTMIGVFGLFVFPPGFIAVAMLIITIFYTIWFFRQFGPLEEFAPLVEYPMPSGMSRVAQDFIYKPPAITPPPQFEDILVAATQSDIENQKHLSDEHTGGIEKTGSVAVETDPTLEYRSVNPGTVHPQ